MNYILKVILTITILSINSIYLFSAPKKVIVHDTIYIEQHMDKLLDSRISLVEKENESLHQLIDNTTASISNSISASDKIINIWGIVISIISIIVSILGIYLGYYVTKTSKKVQAMLDDVNKKNNDIKKIQKMVKTSKKEVIRINEQINKNLSTLYDNLRKEETKALINRLKKEPLDIGNIDTLLLSRNLEEDLFIDLKQAYLNGGDSLEETQQNGNTFKESYFLLFFQHYPYQTILDNDLRTQLMESFFICCNCAFQNDIIKTTKGICKALNEDQVPFNKEELLIKYLEAINSSKHNKFTNLAGIFKNQLKDTELLNSAIKKCKEKKVYLSIFGIDSSQEEVSGSEVAVTSTNNP